MAACAIAIAESDYAGPLIGQVHFSEEGFEAGVLLHLAKVRVSLDEVRVRIAVRLRSLQPLQCLSKFAAISIDLSNGSWRVTLVFRNGQLRCCVRFLLAVQCIERSGSGLVLAIPG